MNDAERWEVKNEKNPKIRQPLVNQNFNSGEGHTRFRKREIKTPNIFKWAIDGLFFFIFVYFNTVDSEQMFNKIFANDWILTVDRWKQPL